MMFFMFYEISYKKMCIFHVYLNAYVKCYNKKRKAFSRIFFLTALLSYNSHIIHFCHLKCTCSEQLCSSVCAAVITVNFRTFSVPSEETLHSGAVTAQLAHSRLPRLGNCCFTFCFFEFVCFGQFMQMELYDVWRFVIGVLHLPLLFLRSINVAVCINASFLLLTNILV